MIRSIKIFFIVFFLGCGLFAQSNTDDYLRNAKSYFWLSRSRNNAVYEAQTALEKQSFSSESITPKYLKEQTEKKINKLKTIQLHEDILSVINLVLK